MSDTEDTAEQSSLAKGLIAGLIGGLAGTLAMTFAERIFPPRSEQPTEPGTNAASAEAIRWGFGAAAGAAYGALVEYFPVATAKEGASFGIALETLTQQTALPALGLSADPADSTTRERASELTSHVVYGVATELVRRTVRKLL